MLRGLLALPACLAGAVLTCRRKLILYQGKTITIIALPRRATFMTFIHAWSRNSCRSIFRETPTSSFKTLPGRPG